MEPARSAAPFTHAAWSFLLPPGGYRMLAEFGEGRCVLHSRNHVDTTARFPEVSEALAGLALGRTVLDGEICVLDAAGRNQPARLHERALLPAPRPGAAAVSFCARDLLVFDGRDVRGLPWPARRRLLRALPLEGPALRRPLAVDGEGFWLAVQAGALGLRTLLALRSDAPYSGGRSPALLQVPAMP